MSSEGAQVVVCGRRGDYLNEKAKIISEKTKNDVLPIQADVSKADDCKRLVEETISKFKKIDVLVSTSIIENGLDISNVNTIIINNAHLFNFPIHRPYFQLENDQKELLWNGNDYFTGIHAFFAKIEKKNYKIQNRVLLSRYRGKTFCSECKGTRGLIIIPITKIDTAIFMIFFILLFISFQDIRNILAEFKTFT